MFYGEYEHAIDRKGRLIIPSRLRDAAKANFVEKFYLTRGLDGCLFLFSEEQWRQQEDKLKKLSFTKKEARKFNRLYFSGAQEVTCDQQGRILIPGYLKEFADIAKDVIIVGVSNRIEIWSKQSWKEFYESSKGEFEDIAERLIEDEGGE